jgi:signal transduction histidine kinase
MTPSYEPAWSGTDALLDDVENIQRITFIPLLLESITSITGMGFAVIARVTMDRWIACAVRDTIGFGLVPGSELALDSTLCSEIWETRQTIVFDEVTRDAVYCHHHTPKIYGLQSYISMPIILKDGSFFGTVCAVDRRPAQVNNDKVLSLFRLFVELIVLQLSVQSAADTPGDQTVGKQLVINNLASHRLEASLQKLELYSDLLLSQGVGNEKVAAIARKIHGHVAALSRGTSHLHELTPSDLDDPRREICDLNLIVRTVTDKLSIVLRKKGAVIDSEVLHTIGGQPRQLAWFFYHTLQNAMQFARPEIPLRVTINSREMPIDEVLPHLLLDPGRRYVEVRIEDNGSGIVPDRYERISRLLKSKTSSATAGCLGAGLPVCKKIADNHRGILLIDSIVGLGTVFTLVLPFD